MQALRFDEFCSFDRVRLQTLPDPQPKSDELVVRIRAAALYPSDAKNILGRVEGTTLPRTPGRDFAGVVVTGPSQRLARKPGAPAATSASRVTALTPSCFSFQWMACAPNRKTYLSKKPQQPARLS
jgi:NADPH:quinone reductase-like Zn-dependent oxidoreductase